MFKKLIQAKLKFFAKKILTKYNPKVIGITGSVGKTSAREAISAVLVSKFKIRASVKNYNNELGVPLTIIGVESPGKSIFGWIAVLLKAVNLIIFKDKNYPEVLILEMGIDRPGDMDYLASIVKCDIGVVTSIGESHLEYFGSVEKIRKEKAKLIKNLKKNGTAILNFDDKKTNEIAKDSKVKIIKFGFQDGAYVEASNLVFKFEETKNINKLGGLSFKLSYEGSTVPVLLPNVIGLPAVYASLAGASVGLAMKMNLVEIANVLKKFDSPKGRMKLIKGIKRTMIIDDTYNASPQSSLSAIEFLSKLETDTDFRKIAVLGDMLELGRYTEEAHLAVGRALAKAGFDMLITVGKRSKDIARGALELGMEEEQMAYFDNTFSAGKYVQEKMHKGDLVLVKGSQGMRMEKIVKEIMADPLKAGELLVRQGDNWEEEEKKKEKLKLYDTKISSAEKKEEKKDEKSKDDKKSKEAKPVDSKSPSDKENKEQKEKNGKEKLEEEAKENKNKLKEDKKKAKQKAKEEKR